MKCYSDVNFTLQLFLGSVISPFLYLFATFSLVLSLGRFYSPQSFGGSSKLLIRRSAKLFVPLPRESLSNMELYFRVAALIAASKDSPLLLLKHSTFTIRLYFLYTFPFFGKRLREVFWTPGVGRVCRVRQSVNHSSHVRVPRRRR